MSILIHINNGVFSKNTIPHNPFNLIGENGAYHLSAKPLCSTIQFRNGDATADIQTASPTSTPPKKTVDFLCIELGLMGINCFGTRNARNVWEVERMWRGVEEELKRRWRRFVFSSLSPFVFLTLRPSSLRPFLSSSLCLFVLSLFVSLSLWLFVFLSFCLFVPSSLPLFDS